MQNTHTHAIQLFITFEKINSKIWLSKKLNINHSILLIPSNWFYSINLFFKNELYLSNSSLIENSAIDSSNYNQTSNSLSSSAIENMFCMNKLILFYNYYNYTIKCKLTLVVIILRTKKYIESIDKVYPNANWLERETSEMYGISYKWKTDTRKLLLDYSKVENPMLKEFQTEGTQDVFYSLLDNQVIALKNETIEL